MVKTGLTDTTGGSLPLVRAGGVVGGTVLLLGAAYVVKRTFYTPEVVSCQ
jgi:hypothetical protein